MILFGDLANEGGEVHISVDEKDELALETIVATV